MNKSLLSTDKIQIDLYRILKSERRHTIGLCMVDILLFLSLFIVAGLIGMLAKSFWVGFVLFMLALTVSLTDILRKFIPFISLKNEIQKGNFVLTTEVLVSVGKEKEYMPHLRGTATDRTGEGLYNHRERIVAVLNFPSGAWFIPESLYEWSRENKMSYADIRDTSEAGDQFYIVVYNKSKKIGCAYNKKFFTLIEHSRHDENVEEKAFH